MHYIQHSLSLYRKYSQVIKEGILSFVFNGNVNKIVLVCYEVETSQTVFFLLKCTVREKQNSNWFASKFFIWLV